MVKQTVFILTLAALLMAACTPTAPPQELPDTGLPENAIACPEEVPEVCTMEYNPVCGSDGQTHGNSCTACSEEVEWYVPGECEPKYAICRDAGMNLEQFGYTCVEECPEGMDLYGAQIGLLCINHMNEEDIRSWEICSSNDECGGQTCALASRTTDDQVIEWESRSEGFRCLPDEYSNFLINYGMELADGSVVIA